MQKILDQLLSKFFTIERIQIDDKNLDEKKKEEIEKYFANKKLSPEAKEHMNIKLGLTDNTSSNKPPVTEQKILNQAFIATFLFVGFNTFILLLWGDTLTIDWFGIIELILFLTLGYLTKKGNKNASILLLVLFIFDRIIYIINWSSQFTEKPFNIITPLLISFVLWGYFYKAYLVIKRREKKEDKPS